MSDEQTYTERSIEPAVVKAVGEHGSLETEDGWGFGGHPSLTVLDPGETIEVEYRGPSGIGGQIVGIRYAGEWLYRRSDQDLEQARTEMLERFERERREALETNREDWTRREAALPEWLRDRLATFHERAGERFELDGWGYELIVCELAALYAADERWIGEASQIEDAWSRMSIDDPEPVAVLAREEGTTGNQHMVAQALAIRHAKTGQSAGGTTSALAPLTGSADYSPKD